MSQSNYNIPNQSAPAVRAQLNSVFGSIATNNSGSAAPSTTFAHQWWYDTTTNILKQRNAANSGWIDIGTFDQTGGTFTPTGQRDLASEAEAEAGTDNTKIMTPLRTAQAVPAALNATGSAPVYACRAWVNFDGTGTPAIRASGNVSSITDNGVGNYTVNFTTAMEDGDYAVVCNAMAFDGLGGVRFHGAGTKTTTSVKIYCTNDGRGGTDSPFTDVAIFR
jgi:hypothetical protein